MLQIAKEVIEKPDCISCGKEKGWIGLAGGFVCSKCFNNWNHAKNSELLNQVKKANIIVEEKQ